MIDSTKFSALPNNKKGSLAELVACQWLLLQGYEVYKNTCAYGAADLVAIKGNEVLLVDVGFTKNSDTKSTCAQQRQSEGRDICFLYVFPDGSCKWRDDAFPVITKTCPACLREYQAKAADIRKYCKPCSYHGRRPAKPEFVNQKQKHKHEADMRLRAMDIKHNM